MARNVVVPIRFTTDERAQLYEQARPYRVSLSEFVRRAVLKRRMPVAAAPEVNRETYRELCRIGNNVNQLARAVDEGRAPGVDPKLLVELQRIVKEVGLQCVGVGPG
jgi:Bacterial mobilisation protein (MobC)